MTVVLLSTGASGCLELRHPRCATFCLPQYRRPRFETDSARCAPILTKTPPRA